MKTLLSKVTSAAGAAFAILAALVVAGLSLTVLFYLALIGPVIMGLSLLAAPFVAMTQRRADPVCGRQKVYGTSTRT